MMIICTNFVIINIKILIQRKFKNMITYLKLWWNLKSKEFFMVFMNTIVAGDPYKLLPTR